jgi:uncharacterized protein
MHPAITAYTSEMFYEGRLHSHPGRELLAVIAAPPLAGSGIRFIGVPHEGNSNDAPEEAQAIAEVVRRLLESPPNWLSGRWAFPQTLSSASSCRDSSNRVLKKRAERWDRV